MFASIFLRVVSVSRAVRCSRPRDFSSANAAHHVVDDFLFDRLSQTTPIFFVFAFAFILTVRGPVGGRSYSVFPCDVAK